jgi:hypothetical protein
MKELFIAILLTITISAKATTYFIGPAGSDKTGNGTKNKPWATLSFACKMVTAEGDIIHIKTGTYIETQACKLSSGINIEGEGIKTIIKSHYDGKSSDNYDALMQLISESITKGNQQICNLKIDGDNMTGDKAIAVFNRSNISIHDCTIVDFDIQGIRFGGGLQSGNSVFNNFIINCAGVTNDQHACLSINDNTGMHVFNNTITQTWRPNGRNGTCVESWKGLKDLKLYDNTITSLPYTEGNWSFAFEFWLTEGGIEIYNNKISGCIDFGKDVYKGIYKYGLDFHHNVVGYDKLQNTYTDGIQLEQTIESVIIRNNLFKNLERPIYFCQYNYSDDYVKDIYIYDNLIIGVGRNGAKVGNGIYFESGPIPPRFESNINIWNNTIIGNRTYQPQNGIFLPTSHKVTTISIRNNIIVGFNNAPIIASAQASKGSIDKLSIENNLFYHNGNRNNPKFYRIKPGNVTYTKNNKSVNPLFVSETDFHLKSGSPAISAGINAGIQVDHDDKPFASPPSIGAYEYFLY